MNLSEGPPKKEPRVPFSVVEASETLEPGQNFYDQPPFKAVIGAVSSKYHLPAERLREIISSLAQLGVPWGVGKSTKATDLNSQQLAKKVQNPYDLDVRDVLKQHKVVRGDIPYFEALHEIFDKLSEYPYWHNYAVEQKSQPFYRADGTYLEAPKLSKIPNFPETYAKYASVKIKRSHNAVLLGIEEVFPQDFKRVSPSLDEPTTEGKSQTRRWAILKTSELIKSRR